MARLQRAYVPDEMQNACEFCSSKCVAKVCRSVCREIQLPRPAISGPCGRRVVVDPAGRASP